jgi:hypothetical protein
VIGHTETETTRPKLSDNSSVAKKREDVNDDLDKYLYNFGAIVRKQLTQHYLKTKSPTINRRA